MSNRPIAIFDADNVRCPRCGVYVTGRSSVGCGWSLTTCGAKRHGSICHQAMFRVFAAGIVIVAAIEPDELGRACAEDWDARRLLIELGLDGRLLAPLPRAA